MVQIPLNFSSRKAKLRPERLVLPYIIEDREADEQKEGETAKEFPE